MFRPNIPPLDSQGAGPVDADERAGASDLVRGVDDWPFLKDSQRGLDLGKSPVDLLRDVLRLAVAFLQFVEFGSEGVVRGDLVLGERALLADEPAEIVGVAVREIGRGLDPFPAFSTDRVGFAVELLRHEAVEQGRVLQPAAVVRVEQIAQDEAAFGLIGFDANELRPLVGGAHRALGQHAADLMRLLGIRPLQRLPHLLLTRMVGIDREAHQLIQGHAVLRIDIEQLGRDGSEAQPLADHHNRDEERRRDLFLRLSLLAQRQERAELVERMERGALDVLGEAVFLGQPLGAHHARDRSVAGEPLLLDQEFERAEAASAGRHLEHASLGALIVEDGPDGKALQQRAASDVFRKLLD